MEREIRGVNNLEGNCPVPLTEALMSGNGKLKLHGMEWSVEQDGLLTSCDVSHDGKYVVSGSDIENAICLIDAANAEQVAYIREHHASTVRRCRFDPHNQRIATVSSDMSVKFWDILAQSTTITIEK
ncbi:UNVERIFIED_CONTAM: hypothetical protein K2H54_037383 [Gekko kuhli]